MKEGLFATVSILLELLLSFRGVRAACNTDANGIPFTKYTGRVCTGEDDVPPSAAVTITYSPAGMLWEITNEYIYCANLADPDPVSLHSNGLTYTARTDMPSGYEDLDCNFIVDLNLDLSLEGRAYGYTCTSEPLTAAPCGPGGSGTGPSTGTTSGVQCFSGTLVVEVLDLGPVKMQDVQLGDWVLTRKEDDGNDIYEPVYAFGHEDPLASANFLQIHTVATERQGNSRTGAHTRPIEVTDEHMLFVHGTPNPIPAALIKVGDKLQSVHEGTARMVTHVERVTKQGLYAPLTPSGVFVVDGVVVSSYITLQDGNEFVKIHGFTTHLSQQQYVHLLLAPFRLSCRFFAAFDVSFEGLLDSNTEGMPVWIRYGIRYIKAAHRQNVMLELSMLLLIMIVAIPFWLLESIIAKGAADCPPVLEVVIPFAFSFLFLSWFFKANSSPYIRSTKKVAN